MLMTNWKKICLGLTAAVIVASCSISTNMDATIERDVDAATKLKEDAKEHGWMVGQFDIRLGRLHKENLNLKQLIVRGVEKDESAEDILRIAEKLELIKRG